METEQGHIARLSSTIAELETSIATLKQEIADLNKALSEATELRNEEKSDNEKTIADAEAGENAVREAVSILQNYYGFLQTGSKKAISLHRQPSRGADREGNTVGDLAPDTFDEEYRGAQEESKGIVGLLEVIASDYKRTQDTVSADEADAAAAHAEFEDKTKADIKEKEDQVDADEGSKSDAEDDLADAEDNLKLESEKNATALKELDVLKAKCVDNTVSYAERVKRRKQEIQALKDALAILEEMSFLARRE
jgi:chromosome segregation ATPase